MVENNQVIKNKTENWVMLKPVENNPHDPYDIYPENNEIRWLVYNWSRSFINSILLIDLENQI